MQIQSAVLFIPTDKHAVGSQKKLAGLSFRAVAVQIEQAERILININVVEQIVIAQPHERTTGGDVDQAYFPFQILAVTAHIDLHLAALLRQHGREPEAEFFEHARPQAQPFVPTQLPP